MIPTLTQLFNEAIGEFGNDFGWSPTSPPGPGGGAPGEGHPIYSPVAGVFSVEQKGKADWGNRGIVFASSGYSFAAGHLLKFAAVPGQKIKVGDLIGWSGGAVSDPNSGNTTGPHVEIQFFKGALDSAASYIDPQKVPGIGALLDTIFNGTKGAGAVGGRVVAGGAPDLNPFDALGRSIKGFQDATGRVLWLLLGIGLVLLGLAFLVAEDFASDAKQAAQALAHNPEVLEAAA